MRKIFTLFAFAVLSAFAAGAAETTITFDASEYAKAHPDPEAEFYGKRLEPLSFTSDGITVTISAGWFEVKDIYAHLRIYQNSTLTITSSVGNISTIEFESLADHEKEYGLRHLNCNRGAIDFTGNNVIVWGADGRSPKAEFTADMQVRITRFTVTITDETAIPQACYIVGNVMASSSAEPNPRAWDIQAGVPLAKTASGVFEGEVYFDEVGYFTIFDSINGSWGALMPHRWISSTVQSDATPLELTLGVVYPIHRGYNGSAVDTTYPESMHLPLVGTYNVKVDFIEGTITIDDVEPHLYVLGHLTADDGSDVHMVANKGVAIYETAEAGVYQGEVNLLWGYSGGFLITEKLGNDRYDWDTVNANRWWPTTAEAVYMETLGIGYPATKAGSVGSWAVANEGTYTIKVDTNTGYVYVGQNDPGTCSVNLFIITPATIQYAYSLPLGQSAPNVFEGELNPMIIGRVISNVDLSSATLAIGVNANADYEYSSTYTWGGTTASPSLALGTNNMKAGGNLWSITDIISAASANPTATIPLKVDFNAATFTVGNGSLKGDINGDGSIDGNDVSILLEMVLAGNVTAEQKAVADINGDNSVDGNDVSILLEMVLAGN